MVFRYFSFLSVTVFNLLPKVVTSLNLGIVISDYPEFLNTLGKDVN